MKKTELENDAKFAKFNENLLSEEDMKEINGGMNLEGRRLSTNVIDLRYSENAFIYAGCKLVGVEAILYTR